MINSTPKNKDTKNITINNKCYTDPKRMDNTMALL